VLQVAEKVVVGKLRQSPFFSFFLKKEERMIGVAYGKLNLHTKFAFVKLYEI